MKIEKIEKIEMKRPAVYVTATPIGNYKDITLRGLQVLYSADILICEERKVASKLLNEYGIKQKLIELNEHNEQERSREISLRIISENLAAALISDAGTPLFADPGNRFIPECYQNGIEIIPVPGASSLMAALSAAGISSRSFLFYGFLPANRKARQQAIRRLPHEFDIVLLEAPYRLQQVITDLHKLLGDRREAVLAWKLTYPQEKILCGSLAEIAAAAKNMPKGEFVIIIRRRRKK